ncbi:hypothetical protein CJU79_05140 [Pseudomonas fragi]|nr:hypothetical protein CJU79_05140 [Pseudomonas fragi]
MLERFFLHYLLNLLRGQEWYAPCYVDSGVNAPPLDGNTNRGAAKIPRLELDKEFNSSSERFSLTVRAMHPSLKAYAA